MISLRRPWVTLAVLAAALLMSSVVPTVDAGMPRARAYHAGGAIRLDTNLLSVSGASAWAIDEYLKATTSLPPLGTAFIAAEKRYGVNARFLLAAAMHESAWGTGYISRKKHNLFGHNAFDRDPLRFATAFATYAASIDSTARFIKEAYLTPHGRWWGGRPTLRSMQQFWSSSHRWGIGVSRIATSIHLHSLASRSIRFVAPVVSGPLKGQSQALVVLGWAGGAIPAGVKFVATWERIRARCAGRRRDHPVSPDRRVGCCRRAGACGCICRCVAALAAPERRGSDRAHERGRAPGPNRGAHDHCRRARAT